MKNKDVIELDENVSLFDELVGAEFIMALYKNIKRISDKANEIKAIKNPTVKYLEVQDELQKLFREYADKNKDGSLKRTKNDKDEDILNISSKSKFDEYKVKEAIILKDNNKTIALQDEKSNEYDRIIENDSTIEIVMISEEYIPKNITFKQRVLLDFMISD